MILHIDVAMTSEIELTGNDGVARDETGALIPVIEEQLIVGKRIVERGKVIVSKTVEAVSESINIDLLHDEHIIEHVPVNELVEQIPLVRYEGETIIIPVLKEVLVKRVLLVEEIKITKRTVQTSDVQEVSLLKETVIVDHLTNNGF